MEIGGGIGKSKTVVALRKNILDRLSDGDVLVHDGATGTELEARGVDFSSGIWSAAANLEAPDVLRTIHEDYLRAGADIITANNFCTGPTFLDRIGEGARWREYSQAGLDIALAARDAVNSGAYVAGGIYAEGVYGTEYTERARLLADGGADFILAEHLPSVNDCVKAAQACSRIDLPLFLGVGNLGPDGTLADRTPIEALVSALEAYKVAGLLFMCTFPPPISKALPRLRESFSGFIGAYAHGGWSNREDSPWATEPESDQQTPYYSPEVLAEYVPTWTEMGAQVVGGCCGTSPAHIAALPSAIK